MIKPYELYDYAATLWIRIRSWPTGRGDPGISGVGRVGRSKAVVC